MVWDWAYVIRYFADMIWRPRALWRPELHRPMVVPVWQFLVLVDHLERVAWRWPWWRSWRLWLLLRSWGDHADDCRALLVDQHRLASRASRFSINRADISCYFANPLIEDTIPLRSLAPGDWPLLEVALQDYWSHCRHWAGQTVEKPEEHMAHQYDMMATQDLISRIKAIIRGGVDSSGNPVQASPSASSASSASSSFQRPPWRRR